MQIPKNCEESSLSFKVQGFKFKGTVEVVYNEGRDLFDLSFIKRNKVVKSIDGVFFDSLVEVRPLGARYLNLLALMPHLH